MSFSSKLGQNSIAGSISEIECDSDSFDSPQCYSTPNLALNTKSPVNVPVKDFKQNLENEKRMRKYLAKIESMNVPSSLRNERMIEIMERNYKLQVQTLLEEVNQLKLDKKICEKKMEKVLKMYKGSASPLKSRIDCGSETNLDDPMIKRTLEAKSSTINELEFQLSQVKKENASLKTRLEVQGRQIQEFVKRVADAENLKEIVEEKDEEITKLKANLDSEELRHDKILKELSYLRNENIAIKLKSQCPNCSQAPTGTSSFAQQHWSSSKDYSSSFFLPAKYGHHRAHSDMRTIDKILNFSELNDDQKGSPSQSTIKHTGKTLGSTNRTQETIEEEPEKPKSEFSKLQKLSMKVLSEYEEGIKNDKANDVKNNSKTLDRIIEVNKIKSYVIEAQNKKLLSMLNCNREEKNQSQKNV